MASYALDDFRRRLLHQAGVRKRYDPIEAPQRHRNETQSQERKRPPRIALTCSKNFLFACSLWLMGWEAALLHSSGAPPGRLGNDVGEGRPAPA
jgi:hypothetical protein